MPRRKGQGISPTKRIPVTARDNGVQARKRPAESNEDPGLGPSRVQVQEMASTTDDTADLHNSKYLHKKFKKMATSCRSTADSPPLAQPAMANGDASPSRENHEVKCAPRSKEDGTVSPASSGMVLPSQGRYVCPYCKLACAKPSVLQKHIRAHTNERPYPCGPCGFAFKTKSNLYKHCRSRAHALKMEEHGSKFSYPLEESSDIEDEEDENNSNNTPPPPTALATSTAVSGTPTIPPKAETTEKRTIYKPKFHKAAIYHEEEETKGTNLCLKIPVPLVGNVPGVGSVLSKTPGSPSSEFLQRHISKIISENQAIVDTMDLWPKKHSRQKDKDGSPASPLSASTSPGIDHANWFKKFLRPLSLTESEDERLKAHQVAQSKLALALLRPNVPSSPPPELVYNQQPLNLTTNHAKDDAAYQHRKRSLSEGFGVVLSKQATAPKDPTSLSRIHHSKSRPEDMLPDGFPKNADKYFHPQNPEGSIIKDLLLKARAASAAGLTIQGFQEIVESEFVSSALPHLQCQEEYLISQASQYVCHVCKVSYCSAENLEIHQMYYCKGESFPVSPQHSPNSKVSSATRDSQEEGSYSKSKLAKGKAKLDLKITPVKEGSKICQPFPSPGPLLGNTPLVESYYYGKKDDEDFVRSHKKHRLDSETSSRSSPNSSHETRSVSSPFPSMSAGGTTTLRSLEELSKCPMRPNSLQMFGGEVSILDGAGETKTMRIEPRGKSPSASEYISLPNAHPAKSESVEASGSSSPHIVVTIARSSLHSGGTIVQVPLKANTATTLAVKPPRSSGGSVNTASPMSLSPLQRTHRLSLSSPPTPFTSSYTSTVTVSSSYPDTPKLMPNIATPNLAVPGIPAPNLSHHFPFLPFTSILPDGTLLNPLTNITAFNPLTLPPHSGMLSNVFLSPKEVDASGVVTILHGGKSIPYVQGMPGPQSLLGSGTNITARKMLSPKPLDLASPLKEGTSTKADTLQTTRPQPWHGAKSKLHKSSSYTTSTVIQSSHRKTPQKEMSSPKAHATKSGHVPTASLPQAPKVLMTIPSIKVDIISSVSESSSEELTKAVARKLIIKKSDKLEPSKEMPAKTSTEECNSPIAAPDEDAKCGSNRPKFLRPTSLPLKPGTFVPKSNHGLSSGMSLVSPETPRPKKSYGQLYLNGHSYTYLALKCSTRPFYCTLNRPQPMYVPLSPEHSKISMYSNWKVCSEADPNPLGLDPGKAMAFYDSRHRSMLYTVAQPASSVALTVTHSSYWRNKLAVSSHSFPDQDERSDHSDVSGILGQGESAPKRIKIFDGGFESNEEYIYVRGRGRGRYVCEECGIRCKKPSMLKKHIRTHTDVRPFTCKHCNFSFKTKGNLTKHMKSKAHYKKCVELGIVPVPTVVDDSYIDEECLARQQALRASRHDNGDTESDENDEEDEDDEDEDEDEDDLGDDEGRLEREAACSLLSLSESTRYTTNHRYLCLGLVPLPSTISRPTTYPYVLTYAAPKPNQPLAEPQTPTLTNLTAQTEREKVTRNSGLALEFRDDPIEDGNCRNSGNVLVAPTGEKNRCYFPSRRTPTIAKSVSEKSWSDEDSEDYSDESDSSERGKSEKSFKFRGSEEKGLKDIGKLETNAEQAPMDLSNKSLGVKLSRPTPISDVLTPVAEHAVLSFLGVKNYGAPTTPISDILTPVAEPAVLASLCSSMERFPMPQVLPANIKETTMLQAYLTEKALQDVRVKQHQRRHNHGFAVAQSPMQAKEVWIRQLEEDKKETMTSKNPHFEPKPNQILVSILKVPKESPINVTERSSLLDKNGDVLYRSMDKEGDLRVAQSSAHRGQVNNVQEMETDQSEVREKITEEEPVCAKPMKELVLRKSKPEPEKTGGETFQLESNESLSEKLACVSIANSMVRNVVVGGIAFQPSSPKSPSMAKPKAEFMPPSAGGTASYCSVLEDGRSICVICNKIFSKPSQLRLHVNIHYFERPFRCESCAVSFRTKGHLQKHERSVSHQNKVSMNSTFGTATMTNPRPFKCDDCKIAFRIHGHLAKHLRSKMHIMKLECVGKLPFGTYAEMEREGVSLNDIDTSDCDNSLESLQVLAQKLYEKDPSKLGQWDGERGELLNPNPPLSGGDTSSDEGEPCLSPPRPYLPHEEMAKSLKTDTMSRPEGRQPLYPTLVRPTLLEPVAKNPVPETGRKRKSIEELDYTDTSDGDNEANLNGKYSCNICLATFSTVTSLHVHSFVEHDSSTEEDKKQPQQHVFSARGNTSFKDRRLSDRTIAFTNDDRILKPKPTIDNGDKEPNESNSDGNKVGLRKIVLNE